MTGKCETCRWWRSEGRIEYLQFPGRIEKMEYTVTVCKFMPQAITKRSDDFCGQWSESERRTFSADGAIQQ